jgi:tetratricopeptide (TPR) repeat protein
MNIAFRHEGVAPAPASRRARGLLASVLLAYVRPLLALAGALLVAACGTQSVLDSSDEYMRVGQVRFAYSEVDSARTAQQAAGSVDPALEARWRHLRTLYMIDLGRQEIYADNESKGLEHLAEALTLEADNREAMDLVRRANRKMAVRATRQGQDHLAKNELEAALTAFGEALGFLPGYKPAVEGIASVRAAVGRMHREAQEQFLEAIRKLPQLRYFEVDWHASVAIARDPTRNDAEDVRDRALRQLAESARAEAKRSEEAGSYGAALMCYRSARDLWPEMPGIRENIEQMQREVEAQWRIERAALSIRSNKLAEARQLLAEAFELSSLERAAISELQLETRKQEGRLTYQSARDMELQGMKAEALAAFESLSKDWPDGLVDEKTRIGALRSDIEGAEKAFTAGESAEAAGDLPAALKHYREAEIYYAGYRDVAARVARLTAAVDRSGGSP